MKNSEWIFLIVTITPVFALGQGASSQSFDSDHQGIRWSSELNLEQIKQEAKEKNKYIFIDCYTTWCGPCKIMDKIYTNDTVGKYFNDEFLSVRVQLDKTEKDDEATKGSYAEAADISREYRVTAYPTLLFLSPGGKLVQKVVGSMPAADLLQVAKTATVPGTVFHDPYAIYDSLMSLYSLGKKDYSRMPYLIESARALDDTTVMRQLFRDFIAHLASLPDTSLYTPDNIKFLAGHMNSKARLFSVFYPDGAKADSAVHSAGYSARIVDQVIQREIVLPFLNIDVNVTRHMPTEYKETNWKELYDKICTKYNPYFAERNLMQAKISWYYYFNNYKAFASNYLLWMEKYGVDTTDLDNNLRMNYYAYVIFVKRINNKSQLSLMSKYMLDALRPSAYDYGMMDTYANLLYKIGKRSEAIHWEQMALTAAAKWKDSEEIDEFKKVISRMKKNRPTW